MTAYRYRKCPNCHSVFPGGQLKPLRYGEGHYHKKGGSLRRCPNCGRTGFTQQFVVVHGYLDKWLRIPRVKTVGSLSLWVSKLPVVLRATT